MAQIFLACCAFTDKGYKKFMAVLLTRFYIDLTIFHIKPKKYD
ncbi:hypothetical protein M917_2561 [Psychrobacter aquaticus CMS 56]|uniref:Uncharacterized protein n=1 Tax=Psychrobacter aquaticus CMS 56 TaxID=1354303 RepID=U4T7E0_9GAMM|nr:hypothetical protein M917_2561 [Psychrobacter aquaticus CMS 56]